MGNFCQSVHLHADSYCFEARFEERNPQEEGYLTTIGTNSMVQDSSNFGIWVSPSIKMNGMTAVFSPFFDWFVGFVEMNGHRE
jgi:hypothetical protein